MTLVELLSEALRARMRAGEGEVAPVALLWLDPERQWSGLIEAAGRLMPELFSLSSEYAPERRMGPAIWLRCVVDRAVPQAPTEMAGPVFYLGGVSRQELQNGDCEARLLPLVELLYRGRTWVNPATERVWGVAEFLAAQGLEIGSDPATEEAVGRNLASLAEADLAGWQGKRLTAAEFDQLQISDPVRDLLRWMSQPSFAKTLRERGAWEAFSSSCLREFGFDPGEGAEMAAAKLANGEARWDRVWQRFAEAPRLYPGLAALLDHPVGRGQGQLGFAAERDPRYNRGQEAELRRELSAAGGRTAGEARERVLELEAAHGARREWAWSELGQSPWAGALLGLSRLAQHTARALTGNDLDEMVASYAEWGWRCDAAGLEAMAAFRPGEDAQMAAGLVQTMYEPWLDGAARLFQQRWEEAAPARRAEARAKGEKGVGVVFVDGLRFDLGMGLAERLEARSLRVRRGRRLAPVPTVTATAKPAAAPLGHLAAGGGGGDFAPEWRGRRLAGPVFQQALREAGVQVFERDAEDLSPREAPAGGWIECGRIDELGHSLQGELARQLEPELERVAERVAAMLDAGWRRVRVVTDHGWLLMAGGLPKLALPAYLTGTKWGRCAIAAGDTGSLPSYGWQWNSEVRITCPPGIAAFRAGTAYAHGGVSPQESIVPELEVERDRAAASGRLGAIVWRGMRCRVTVEGLSGKVFASIRESWNEGKNGVSGEKEVGPSGEVSLLVADDLHLNKEVWVVLSDGTGKVLAQERSRVGGGE